MITEQNNLHYILPFDALYARNWLQHGIESMDSDKTLRRFTACIDGLAVAFFCGLNTCSYAALTIVETLADLIKAHPADALNSIGRNLLKAVGSFAGIFFGLYMAASAIFTSHKYMKYYTPINPKAPGEQLVDSLRAEKKVLEQQLAQANENIETFEQTKAELEARIATSDQEKEALEQQLALVNEDAETFEQTRADLEARIATSDQEKEALEEKLTTAKTANEQLESTKIDLEKRLEALAKEKEATLENIDENLVAQHLKLQRKVQVLQQHVEITNLKLEIKMLNRSIEQSNAVNKNEKLEQVLNVFKSANGQDMLNSLSVQNVDEYQPVSDEQDNISAIQTLQRKKELLKAQLDYLETSKLNEEKLLNKARFASPGYSDPYEGHNLTVHLDCIAKQIGEGALRVESSKKCKMAIALSNQMRWTPEERFGSFVKALREVCVSSLPMDKRERLYNAHKTRHGKSNADFWLALPEKVMTDFQKQVLLIHMSGVDDSGFLKKLTDRILDLSPSDDHEIADALKSLIETNQAVDNAPRVFLTNKSAGKLEGAIGTKDFLGVDGGNVPNVRGTIQFGSQDVTFLRAPTPSLPNYENPLLKNIVGLGNAAVSHFYDTDNGNGEMLAPEEAAFCQILEEKNQSMLVAVHECLSGVERGRCLLRMNLEKLSSSYLALFQPYDGALYDSIAGDGTFTAMKKTLKEAYCHNDVNSPYGCLLPFAVRDNPELIEAYKTEIDKLVDYVQEVYFNNSYKIELEYEISYGLDKSKHYKPELMSQRAFLHFFYIAQSEHMMVWLRDKLDGKELCYFKSQCKDAQDRTGMEAILQEAQYAMRSLSADELNQAIDQIIKKNIGQCIANKGIAFHGKRFILGAIVFGYLLEHFKEELPAAFKDCKHLPGDEKITGMKIEQNLRDTTELTHKSAGSVSTYINTLKLLYHQGVRPLSAIGRSDVTDEFNWMSVDSSEIKDISNKSLPNDSCYSLNGEMDSGTFKRIMAGIKEEDSPDLMRYISEEASDFLLQIMKKELDNPGLYLKFTDTSSTKRIYHYRKVKRLDRVLVLEKPITISQRGRDTNVASCVAYLQVNLSSLKRKRFQNGSYAPVVPPVRWAWRLKDVDNQSPTEKVLGIESQLK